MIAREWQAGDITPIVGLLGVLLISPSCYNSHMERVAHISDKELWLEVLSRPYTLDLPFAGADFACVLFATDASLTAEEQFFLCQQLIAAKCRSVLCAGLDSSAWDDAIDYAYIATDENYSPPNETFVMTAWAENQPINEVLWQALHLMDFDDLHFQRLFILIIGDDRETATAIRACLNQLAD